ncbi:MAG: DUF433 domain-containing protein [Phycisphaerae bacterium]|nr:DUF433 domain-containing protein [Phycisphaerae bacterium]
MAPVSNRWPRSLAIAPYEEILDGYPDLEREDIQQAVEYVAWATQEQVHIA